MLETTIVCRSTLARLGDDLVRACGSGKVALVAIRQAWKRFQGDRPVPARLATMRAKGLATARSLDYVASLMDKGVPARHDVVIPDDCPLVPPHSSVGKVIATVVGTLLKEAAMGWIFIYSRASHATMKVVYSPIAAVPKKDESGDTDGRHRIIHDQSYNMKYLRAAERL